MLDDHSPVTVSARAAPLRRPHCSPPLVAVSAAAAAAAAAAGAAPRSHSVTPHYRR